MDGLSGNGGSSLFANARAGPSAHPCCDAYRFRRFIKLRYRRNKPVAAAGNSLDDRATVADRLADLADALCERLVSHDHVRPNRLDDFVLRHQSAAALDKITQDFKALRA